MKVIIHDLGDAVTYTPVGVGEIATIFCREYLTNFCRKSRSQQNK